MRSSKRWAGAVVTVGAVVALLPLPSAMALVPAGGSGPLSPAPSADRTVTLITGDRVTVAQRAGRLDAVRIEPGPDRQGVVFTTDRTGGRLRVTPSDARAQVAAGRLDPRLFDVTALLDFGYDDRQAHLPLIVTGPQPRIAAATKARTVPGGTALRVPKNDLDQVWRAAAPTKIWLDGLRRPVLTESVPQVGAPAAWAAGFTGTGVKVGVIDSGIDATHPDLAGKVVAERNFVDDGDTRDLTGHGTHVAATVAGIGADGAHRGVAPGVSLVSARVCAIAGCPESAILAGMQWAADQGAKIINVSLGGTDTPERDPLEDAVDRITAESGALFVIAAGNSGEDGDTTISTPGSADSALTVGAVTKTDELAFFSSRGPRVGDAALKPDITAPGVGIVAAQSRDAVDRDPAVERVAKSGTSMATPHVAGAAAILAQRHPDWTPAQLKAALMGSARTNPKIQVYDQGAGRLDLARGIGQDVLADPPSVSVQDVWPPERKPIARTVTYRNTGSSAVTLALRVRTDAPAGMFALSRSRLTIAPGGTAAVTLSIRTAMRGVKARNVGYLVATAGARAVTTPFVAAVETEETYALKLTQIDRDGAPARDALTALVDVAHDRAVEVTAAAAVRRLPKGRYAALSFFIDEAADTVTLLVRPVLVVDRDVSLTMDARTARPVSVRLPLPDAAEFYTSAFTSASGPAGQAYSIFGGGRSFGHFFFGPAGGVRRDPAIQSGFSALLAKRGVDPDDSPWIADVAWRERGRMFPGLTRSLRPGDLATVHAEYTHHERPDATVEYASVWPGGTFTLTDTVPQRLPGSRVEYFNTDGGIRRQIFLKEGNPFQGLGNSLGSPVRRFAGGRDYRERRNTGVYGPGFGNPPLFDNGWVLRSGDTMRLRPTMLNDALNWAGFPTNGKRGLITLDRNGTRIFERSGNVFNVDVPAGVGAYRLGVDLNRGQALSTRVVCEWTFRSGTTRKDRFTPLPLSAVRFLPVLDGENRAPAGVAYTIPFEVQRQPGSAAAPARTVTVDVSYDDGATWLPGAVRLRGQRGEVRVSHPAGAGFVSLRARSADRAGNTVTETIIRAYRTG